MLSRFITGNAGVVDESELQDKFGRLLTEGETFQAGFRVVRDTFIFTDKRMIIVDVQGMRGKKQEYQTIPYDKSPSTALSPQAILIWTRS